PLIHLTASEATSPLSIARMIPTYWLPEVAINGEAATESGTITWDFWKYTLLLYGAGLSLCFTLVVVQLLQLLRLLRQSETYYMEDLRIAESNENKPTFSFFNFIFIGKA